MKNRILTLFIAFTALLLGCTNDNESDLFPEANTQTTSIIQIGWTAYKYPEFTERVGVSGTFENHEVFFLNESENILDKLTYAEISIPTNSVKVGNDTTRTDNVYNFFFKYFTTNIKGRINSINETEAIIAITINGTTQHIPFSVSLDKDKYNIILTGRIEDINPFGAAIAFYKLNDACGAVHNDFVWPDVDIEILVNNYKLLK